MRINSLLTLSPISIIFLYIQRSRRSQLGYVTSTPTRHFHVWKSIDPTQWPISANIGVSKRFITGNITYGILIHLVVLLSFHFHVIQSLLPDLLLFLAGLRYLHDLFLREFHFITLVSIICIVYFNLYGIVSGAYGTYENHGDGNYDWLQCT